MDLNVLKLIDEFSADSLLDSNSCENRISDIIQNKPESCYFISPVSIFKKLCRMNSILNNYHIVGIFDLSTCCEPEIGVRLSLYVLSNNESKLIKTGVYLNKIKIRGSQKKILSLSAIDSFVEYCNVINGWLNSDEQTPEDTNDYEFNLIERENFDIDFPNADCYKKEVIKTLKFLEKEKTIPLSSVAEIITPRCVKHGTGKTLTMECLKYPFNFSALNNTVSTNVKVQNRDIILARETFYFINENLDDVYINRLMKIIRPSSKISAEYLFIYLKSDTAKIIINSKSSNQIIKNISQKELENIPIILPQKDTDKYKAICNQLYFKKEESNINELAKCISSLNPEKETLEGILLQEYIKKLQVIKDPKVRDLIIEDIKELSTCYKYKAYKAALILAGSVLEAFLIDWLGTTHCKDYFSEDYYVQDKYNPSKRKRADLIDYIDSIASIKRPKWMDEAKKAHNIRKKRNMVHAKLCMRNNQDINQETCKMVIEYLIEIISTRFTEFKHKAEILSNVVD